MNRVKEKRGPGKPRSKGSTLSFGGMGLTPDEDKKIQQALEEKDLSLKQVQRALFRQWIEQGFPGYIMFNGSAVSITKMGK